MRNYIGTIVAIGAIALFASQQIEAASLRDSQVLPVIGSPLTEDPDRQATSIGDTPTVGIADRSPATGGAWQRLVVTNTSFDNNLCVCWVAAAASCASSCDCDLSGTDDGDLILPRANLERNVAGDLRTCIVASASSTVVHISRAEAP